MRINISDYPVPKEKFWLVSADMGYGHQRAIYPLKFLSGDGYILNANKIPDSTPGELSLWKRMQYAYEFLSRGEKLPIVGKIFTQILDRLLYIPSFYPFKDRSKPTFQVRYLRKRIKMGLCNGIIRHIREQQLPVITSFYSVAIAAEMAGFDNIFCIICDTDLSRVWVAEEASKSRITYFAPGSESAQRLLSYGVKENNIILTGLPLPIELLGDRSLNVLRYNLSRRLKNLDPMGVFHNLYKHSVDAFLNDNKTDDFIPEGQKLPLTITYTVGGAGAQKEIGLKLTQSLANKIDENLIILNLVAGTRKELFDYFNMVKRDYANNSKNVRIIWAEDNMAYFDQFNECLHSTDILWTKPSELSFYCALGIPIIMTPSIGPQEKFNRRWLREIGSAFKQKNPEYADQWLFDLLNKGRLAEAAWLGFLKARKYGTYNIIDYLEKGKVNSSIDPLKR